MALREAAVWGRKRTVEQVFDVGVVPECMMVWVERLVRLVAVGNMVQLG